MANTVWAGDSLDKLILQSGQFTSTIKTSEDVTVVETAPTDISYDGTNTPWMGNTADKLYLTSGQFTSTLKDSISITSIDNEPAGISWDGTNTPWSGTQADKLYLQSGQFTSTLKTSENVSAVDNPNGITYDGTNSPWAASVNDKLHLQSGQFTSTIKDSVSVTSIDTQPLGITFDGTDSAWVGNADDKMYLQSGQFTSTLKTSQATTADSFPRGIEFDDTNLRLGVTSTVAISATATLSAQPVINATVAISATATTALIGGIPPARNDTVWAGLSDGKLYLQSGQFTSTIKTSEDVSAVDISPTGITWDGTNSPWTGAAADKLYLQSGQFTSTLKTSESVTAVDILPVGHSWDGTNTPWAGNTAGKLHLQSGQFTSTLKTSEDVSAVDASVICISWDGTNTPWTGFADDKLYLQSGQFTSTLKTSESIFGIDSIPVGISWDGLNTPWAGIASAPDKLYLQSGQFTSTLKTSQGVGSVANIRGTDTTLYLARLGEWKLATVAISATATLNAEPIINATVAISATATVALETVVINRGEVAISATATTTGVLTERRISSAVGRATLTVDISVSMDATNPPLSGDLVDIGNNAVFQLKVNNDLIDFTQVTSCFHAWNMLDLDVSYDGKELSFLEFTGIGSPTYRPEQDVTLEIDFGDGLGLTRLFTGKIKQRDHDGRNNNESVSYTAVDYLQLADDITAINSDGYPQIQFTAPTTTTSVTSVFGSFVNSAFLNGNIPVQQTAPKPIREAVSDLFAFNTAQLAAVGIPTDIGAPGLEQFTGDLPETVTLDAEGFAAALISITNYQSGVKVLFDEKQQKWTFPNLRTVPTVTVDIASTNIPELPFSVDTTDRYTAVHLYADIVDENDLDDMIREKSEIASLGGPLGFGRVQRSEVTMSPQWLVELETDWDLFKGLYSDPSQIEGQNYFVYRRYSIPEGTEPPGFGLEAHAYAKYNQWGNVYWQIVEGRVFWNERVFLAAHPIIARGNVYHSGNAFPADEVKLAYIPGAISYYPATTITSGGTISYSGIATTAGRDQFSDEIRVPPTGFEGTAFSDFSVSREYVAIVDRTEVTTENAQAMLDVRKDAVITGDLPIDGDPIPELITLGVKCLVQHPTKSTGIETFPAFVTQYSYEFGKRGQSTISLSTDIGGLIR